MGSIRALPNPSVLEWIPLVRGEVAPPPALPRREPRQLDPETAGRISRLGTQRQGRGTTVATSRRGLLDLADLGARRKSLLGE